MSVFIYFACDGCDAETKPVRAESEFRSFSGKSYGLGRRLEPSLSSLAPEGWVAYDLIGCTYCPSCVSALNEEPAPPEEAGR